MKQICKCRSSTLILCLVKYLYFSNCGYDFATILALLNPPILYVLEIPWEFPSMIHAATYEVSFIVWIAFLVL